ncbi:uncharacterized protein LOC117331900 isoform X2 [Pecten maximus]|uniref:uncharacterized protein LOC117331900 isoform X2 n=1 Tax=Pecten maximus TaxID=6579 RepID=UPI0014585625|nr:uncharacterized protein LOC117331900 isoform X2 [Pecten maximus]
MKPVVVPVLVLIITLLPQNAADSTTIKLDEGYCRNSLSPSVNPEKLKPGNTIKLVWNSPSIERCSAYFRGVGEDIKDLYKVCVRPLSYTVKDCDVELTYSQGVSIAKSYTCYSTPSTWCTEAGSNLLIRIKSSSSLLDKIIPDVLKPSVTASMTLELYTEEVYTVGAYTKLGMIIGAAGGGIVGVVFIVIFVVCIVQHVRSKRKQRDETHNRRQCHDLPLSQRSDQRANDNLISPSSIPSSVDVNIDGNKYKLDPADLPPPSYDEVMALETEESRPTT